jgi:hypothetical protein
MQSTRLSQQEDMDTLSLGDVLSPVSHGVLPQFEERRPAPEAGKRQLKYAPNRVVRRRERSRVVVENAVPEGHVLATKLSDWLELVWQAPGMVYLNRPRQRRIMAMAKAFLALSDPESFTTTPGHVALADAAEIGYDRVTDYIDWFEAEGLLVTVAKGRSAEKVPKTKTAADGTRWPSADGSVTNERAVYAFIRPLNNETLDVMGSEPVDKVTDPTTPPEYSYPPYARGALGDQEGDGFAATESPSEALYERGVVPHWADRRLPDYRKHETTDAQTKRARRARELHAAVTLQRHSPPLRRISARFIAQVCRRWFRAGWTWGDILRALDARPNNVRWPHDGATGMARMADWLRIRLEAWTFAGEPIYSHRQADLMRTQEARERAYALAMARKNAEVKRVLTCA